MRKFTTKEIGEAIELSDETIRRCIREGQLAAEISGRNYYITEDAVKEFFNERGIRYEETPLAKPTLRQVTTRTVSSLGAIGAIVGIGIAFVAVLLQRSYKEMR
ncbi:helix-turn-helix domain-containing protein [Paenibacillus foliorum]|uniref:helix-turn-helix domain-containing protein n=1 Tax=Paenibacillus foliorum TaxID=2654974 RepID=UPI00149310BB|nr:helix-turn-helix domain-containing protein [Paenibacillus foliorum]